MKKRLAGVLALVLSGVLSPMAVQAQDFPSKPVTMIVPVPPGGSGDMVSRLTASAAASDLGQSIVIENRPGATGNIGTVVAVRSAPDGHTIFLCSIGNCSVNSSLYANPGFDLFKDITPVILLGSSINVLVAGPQSGISSVDDLLKKAKSGQINYGSSGVGASNHLAGEMLKKMAGIKMLHVPYKGSGPAITDLIGGQIQVFFDNEPSIAPFIQSGKVKALAVTGKKRSPNFPDVPTMEELGYKGFIIEPWYAIGAPAGVPAKTVDRLNQAFQNGLKDPKVQKTLQAAGINPIGGPPGVLKDHIKSEYDKWADVIKSQNITTQ